MKNTQKLSLLNFAILGLLKNEPLSGYRIRKVFEDTAMGNYSSSPGAIYPALSKLEQNELVEKITDTETNKQLFKISSTGLKTLKEWILKPIEMNEIEKKMEELLLRFAFMDHLIVKQQKIHFLETFRDLLIEHLNNLEAFYAKESNNLPLHGKLAFEHGLGSNRATLKWSLNALKEIIKN